MSSTYEVINPATESIVKAVELADLAATDAVIVKANKAFESWKKVVPVKVRNADGSPAQGVWFSAKKRLKSTPLAT